MQRSGVLGILPGRAVSLMKTCPSVEVCSWDGCVGTRRYLGLLLVWDLVLNFALESGDECRRMKKSPS